MPLYALTINPGHECHKKTSNDVLIDLTTLRYDYCNVVQHGSDHYHVLISLPYDLKPSAEVGRLFHFAPVRNTKAYLAYMYNHDVTGYVNVGELPYQENDNMIDYAIANGLTKTVQKFGIQALRYYKNLQLFLQDYKIQEGENL
jgi:hypothetical protein